MLTKINEINQTKDISSPEKLILFISSNILSFLKYFYSVKFAMTVLFTDIFLMWLDYKIFRYKMIIPSLVKPS